MKIEKVTRADAVFFMDMVNSSRSPNLGPKPFRNKPYYKILDNLHSEERHRFLAVYNKTKHILTAREQQILDAVYGLYHPRVALREAGQTHNITPERIRQILYKSETKIVSKLSEI